MSWSLKKKAQALLAAEEGAVRKDWGGRISVALVYPNTYAVGMSNLGFQTIYQHLNALPDVVCERVFFPDPEDVDEHAADRGRAVLARIACGPSTDFHLVGFSVTYEGDYINVVRLLRLAGIPLRARAIAGPSDPLVLMGGVCAFSNPEPHGAVHGLRGGRRGRGAGRRDRRRVPVASATGDEAPRAASSTRWSRCPACTCPSATRVRYAADGTIAAVDARRPATCRRS